MSLARLTVSARRWLRRCMPGRLADWLHTLSAQQRQQFGATTRSCSDELLQFGRASDQEFTALAQGLAQLSQHITTLRAQNGEFQLILEDRDADRPLASAQEVYKRSIDLVHASTGIAASEQDQMRGIETALLSACEARDQFKRNQLLLSIITMSIRMEAARMEPENQSIFLNVGDAINDINRKISASTELAFQRIEAVIKETGSERCQLHGIEQDLHARAQSSIRTIQQELGALHAALGPCAEQSRAIATQFATTEPLLLGTIASLQHQDIVRQQLEHVAAGFHDLTQHLGARRIDLGYIHHAAQVQQAQLLSARSEIDRASQAVVTGLRSLLDTSTSLVSAFAAMERAGSAAFADFRIVAMFQEEIGQLARVADKSKETNGNITRLVDRIEEVVRVFAEEVGHHELDVKIVALNAQIASARVPSADALDRLAEETNRVSHQNTEVTRGLLGNLQASLDQLRAIKTSADEFLTIVTEEKTELERGVQQVTSKLTRLSTRVQADAAQVRHAYEAVHRQTAELLQRVRLTTLIERSFPPAERLCTQLLAASATHHEPAALSVHATAQLDAHRDRYTMHKETLTHVTTLTANSSAPARVPAPAPVTVGVASNLGDGIELF